MNETLKRPVRTLLQGGAGYAVVEFIDAFHIYDMDERQYAIATVVIGAAIGWIQVNVENYFGKALLRDIPDESGPE